MRIGVADQPGVLAGISSVLAQAGISVDAMIQHPAGADRLQTQLLILTHEANEAVVNAAIKEIEQLPTVLAPVIRIRKEDFN